MKYIVFQHDIAGIKQEIPIIFPNNLVHLEVAKALTKVIGSSRIVAAGEFSSTDIEADSIGGESTTIGIKSRKMQDKKLIWGIDYTQGLS